MSDAENAVLTETRGRVLLITLNRPEAMNAINTDLAQGLLRAVEQLDGDDGLTAGVLTGAGRGFCAGMDLKAFAAGGTPVGMDVFIENGSKKPLIAAIEGIARNAPLSVAASKTIVRGTQGMTDEEAWEYQKPFVRSVFSSDDAKEGPRAFAEKRAPSWSGK